MNTDEYNKVMVYFQKGFKPKDIKSKKNNLSIYSRGHVYWLFKQFKQDKRRVVFLEETKTIWFGELMEVYKRVCKHCGDTIIFVLKDGFDGIEFKCQCGYRGSIIVK